MAAISGTVLLLYSDGVAIAMQKGISIAMDIDLPDATSKDSAGWANHILGLKNAKIDFNALFGTGLLIDTPSVLSAKNLMDYILNQESLLVSILGFGYPLLGWADMSSLSFDAPMANAMTLAGSLKINGELCICSGINLVTDPDAGVNHTYTTHTVSGTAFTSLICSAAAIVESNDISIATGGIYKLLVRITMTSGQLPTVGLWDNTSAYISNQETLIAGLNLVTLTATATDATASLRWTNSAATNLVTSSIYLFKK
ncbi:MAG: hypothetical protein V1720_00145 [bacterium]